jgi:methylene-tetrahydromethanopterin dehydrogenase
MTRLVVILINDFSIHSLLVNSFPDLNSKEGFGKLKTLELAPLNGKKLHLLLVKKAYNEPWSVTSSPKNESEPRIGVLRRPSMAFCKMVRLLAEREKPDFATDELGMRSAKEFVEKNPLVESFASLRVPFRAVEMDEFARSYLASSIEQKMDKRNEIIDAIQALSKKKTGSKANNQIEQLTAYGQYIQDQFEDELRDIEFGIRESWIAMGILQEADNIEKKKINGIHLCSPQHFEGLMSLLEMVDVDVTPVTFKSEVTGVEDATMKGMTGLTNISSVEMIPVVKHPKDKIQSILFFLEEQAYASPFDVCVAYDAGFDIVVPYSNVSTDNVAPLVHDAIFSRGAKGVKRTCFFIGGRDIAKAREMANDVKNAMVKPFVTSVVVDPHGAFTTSAALVAKAEEALPAMGLDSLANAKVLVLAGTGPVGQSVATLCAAAGAETTITSRSAKRAKNVASHLSTDDNSIRGIQISTPEEMQAALETATLVFATGPPGTELVTKDHLENALINQILLDANAVPPSGIAGLKPSDDLRELVPGKLGIGPLAIGDLKLKVQRNLLRDAREKGKGIYDDSSALEVARTILNELRVTGKTHPPTPLVKTN